MKQHHPVKDTFAHAAPIDDWQFIGSTALTLTVKAYNYEGRYVETLALPVTTVAQTANQLALQVTPKGVGQHFWWQVVSVSTGTCYGLPTGNVATLTTTNGLTLAANDRIGPAPRTGSALVGSDPTLTQVTIVGNSDTLIALAPTLPASATVINGDLLVDTTAMASVALSNAGIARLKQLVLNDEDDNGIALDIFFFTASTTMGATDAPFAPSDALMRTCLGVISVAATDWIDCGGVRIASIILPGDGLMLQAGTGTTTVWYAMVARAAGGNTWTASGIKGMAFVARGL